MFADIAVRNLTSPAVLFFLIGVAASLARSDLSIPDQVARLLSIYLMMSIGFRGGLEISHHGVSPGMIGALGAGVCLSFALPILAERLLRVLTPLAPVDRAAVAGHYGSNSAVTVAAVTAVTGALGMGSDGFMVGVAAAMETPAILSCLLLARGQGQNFTLSTMLREVFLNGSVVVLLGGLAVGIAANPQTTAPVKPFLVDLFPGFLCLFLLEMGLISGRGIRDSWRTITPGLLGFAVVMPLLGATTQNITQTGDLLVLRQAHRIFLRQIGEILSAMADLAEKGADMPLPGRTHGQHAVPATFGYKAAVWIDEFLRHTDRLRDLSPRLFVSMLGGGAGTFASLGEQGPPVQAGIGRILGFGTMQVPSRALGDHLAENICVLGLMAATAGKIGREIYTLMKTEFGEVEEPVPPGTVGSSTMPQKRNPKLCQDIIAAAAEVRAMVPLALEAMMTEHEADRTTSLMMDAAEGRACVAMGDILARLGEILRGLDLNPKRMRANLDLGHGLIMAEALMLDLGRAIGRQHAHDVIYDAAQAAFTRETSFSGLLAADPRVTAHMDAAAIQGMLDPTAYTGLCARMAREQAARARTKAWELLA